MTDRKRRAELDAGGSNLQLSVDNMETRTSLEERTKESARSAALTLAELALEHSDCTEEERRQALRNALDVLGIDWSQARNT